MHSLSEDTMQISLYNWSWREGEHAVHHPDCNQYHPQI